MRDEADQETPVHDLVFCALKKDRDAIWAYFHQRTLQSLDKDLVEIYDLKPPDLPELNLSDNLSFVSGFGYVASHWYPLVRAVATGRIKHGDEYVMDSHLERMFPDGRITTKELNDNLIEDPSGATWLEQRARVEFRQGNLELIGARKAITGIRKMHEAFAS